MQKTKQKRKQKNIIICILVALFLSVGILILTPKAKIAGAETMAPNDNYNFTQVTNEDGETSYKVAIKPAYRSQVEFVVVPETYRGKPVTEVAANGFMSCAKLTKVILPSTLKAVGNNAFMNCLKLKHVSMPNVEKIGSNAFGMCSSVERLFIPNSVTEVGSNILRNNANKVYVQSSAEVVNNLWSSTWSNYFTGEIVYSADPEDTIQYREILSEDKKTVIGYEIKEGQVGDADADVVIYNSVCVDEELGYLPVLNICPEAFFFSNVHSLTIRDRHTDYPEIPSSTHKINIRSNAFLCAFVEEIKIEVGVTFDHPANLQTEYAESMYDGQPIVGDSEGYSTRVFEESTMKCITLPSDTDLLTERMFYNCTYLENIKINGADYDGTNVLPNVNRIGAEAFSCCVALKNITVPSCVNYVGKAAFSNLGEGVTEQIINVDIYKDELPEGWDVNWAANNQDNVKIIYKSLAYITIEVYDGFSLTVAEKPGELVPDIKNYNLKREGYIFNGIYSSEKDGGFQYYNSNLQSARVWNLGDPETLYAHWKPVEYTITYKNLLDGMHLNPSKYTIESETFAFANPTGREGYTGTWDIAGIEKGSTGDKVITAVWNAVEYTVTYENLLGGTNPSTNPVRYTVESQTITFENPVGREGYAGTWDIKSIEQGSTGDKVITAVWTLIEYTITYDVDLKGQINTNPATYTVEDEITFVKLTKEGYIFYWNPEKISKGTTGDIIVEGQWRFLDYSIIYDVDLHGLTNPNPTLYDVETEVKFTKLEREGYTFEWMPAKIEAGTTENLIVKGIWTPIDYTINYVVWSGTLNPNPSTYNVENNVTFYPATYDGYIVEWDRDNTVGCIGDITVTAKYYYMDGLAHCYKRAARRFEIYTPAELDLLREVQTANRTFYVDVDYKNGIWKGVPNFEGVLTGSVKNIRIIPDKDAEYYGFIMKNEGYITDFTIDGTLEVINTHADGKYRHIGMICGLNYGSISGCTVKSSNPISYKMHNGGMGDFGILNVADSNARIGGVVGESFGQFTLKNCNNYLFAYSVSDIGGIGGEIYCDAINCNNYGTICYYSDSEMVGRDIGGIAACNYGGKMENCNNYGDIWYINTEVKEYKYFQPCIGMIVGEIDFQAGGDIEKCSNYGSLQNVDILQGFQSYYVGGLAGYIFDE